MYYTEPLWNIIDTGINGKKPANRAGPGSGAFFDQGIHLCNGFQLCLDVIRESQGPGQTGRWVGAANVVLPTPPFPLIASFIYLSPHFYRRKRADQQLSLISPPDFNYVAIH
jgi:hypothetical protein